MNGEQLKIKTKQGRVVYGSMISIGRNPRWTSAISDLGLDYVVIDMEHAPRGRSEVADYLMAIQSTDIVPIVRIPIPDSHYVTMALDAGAHGVLAPYCETVEEVREVVGASKYRPLKGAKLSYSKEIKSGQVICFIRDKRFYFLTLTVGLDL